MITNVLLIIFIILALAAIGLFIHNNIQINKLKKQQEEESRARYAKELFDSKFGKMSGEITIELKKGSQEWYTNVEEFKDFADANFHDPYSLVYFLKEFDFSITSRHAHYDNKEVKLTFSDTK